MTGYVARSPSAQKERIYQCNSICPALSPLVSEERQLVCPLSPQKSPQVDCGTHAPMDRWLNQVPRWTPMYKANRADVIIRRSHFYTYLEWVAAHFRYCLILAPFQLNRESSLRSSFALMFGSLACRMKWHPSQYCCSGHPTRTYSSVNHREYRIHPCKWRRSYDCYLDSLRSSFRIFCSWVCFPGLAVTV